MLFQPVGAEAALGFAVWAIFMRTNSRQICLSFALVLISLVICGSALAEEVKAYPPCTGEPSESDITAAKGAYQAGQVSFQEADYERSLLYWEDAFRRDCTADKLLLNIARAYELSGDRKRAVNSLQTYVDRKPDAKDRPSVEKWILKLKEAIAEEDAKLAALAPVAPVVAEEKPTDAGESSEPAPEAEPSAKKPIWPIFLVGGGAVLAAVGHTLYYEGDQKREEAGVDAGCTITDEVRECPSEEITDAVNEVGKSERTAGAAILIPGHVIAATGGVLWYLLWTRDPGSTASHRPFLQPVVAPGYQGFSLRGSF